MNLILSGVVSQVLIGNRTLRAGHLPAGDDVYAELSAINAPRLFSDHLRGVAGERGSSVSHVFSGNPAGLLAELYAYTQALGNSSFQAAMKVYEDVGQVAGAFLASASSLDRAYRLDRSVVSSLCTHRGFTMADGYPALNAYFNSVDESKLGEVAVRTVALVAAFKDMTRVAYERPRRKVGEE